MGRELDLAELGLAFAACFMALVIYIVLALSPAMSQGSCWQCMHGCFGRDAEVCRGDPVEPAKARSKEVEVSTKGLRAALKEFNTGSWPSDDYEKKWGEIMKELRKLEYAIQSRLGK